MFRLNFRRQDLLLFYQSLTVGYMLPGIVRQRATSLSATTLYSHYRSPSFALQSSVYIFSITCLFNVHVCSRFSASPRPHPNKKFAPTSFMGAVKNHFKSHGIYYTLLKSVSILLYNVIIIMWRTECLTVHTYIVVSLLFLLSAI